MSKLTTDDERKGFGQRLLLVRMWAYQPQFEFAETLGLSSRAYANYERGEPEMPTAVLLQLYERFKVDPVWVLTGKATAKDAVVPKLRHNRQRPLPTPGVWRDDDLHVAPLGSQAVK